MSNWIDSVSDQSEPTVPRLFGSPFTHKTMKAAPIRELRKALEQLDHHELQDACVRLAKYKADNKELLTYLLLKSHDERNYAREVCDEVEALIDEARSLQKKTIRKIIRLIDRRVRYSGNVETELEIRIHFCRQFANRRIRLGHCRVSANMFERQLDKIEKSLEKVHPDLQFDFRQQMAGLDSVLDS